MKLWKSALVSIVIVAATSGAIALMFTKESGADIAKPTEPVWDARTTTAQLGAFRPQIKLIGQVEPIRDLSEIAQLTAKVLNVYFEDGMQVTQGQLIVQLDDFNAQLQLQQTQADLAELATRVQLQTSQQKLDREALEVERANLVLLEDRLKKQKAISNTQQAIDDLEQQIQRQRFAVLQREAAIKNHPANESQLSIQKQKLELALAAAQRAVANTKISAPFSGRLAQVFVKEGQYTSPGQPLFRLYSEDDMAVVAQLPTRLLQESPTLDGIASEQQRQSQVHFLRSEAQVNAGQSGFKTWFRLDDANQWLPGDIAYLTLNLAAKPQSIKVPAASVFQDRWIYSVDDEQRLNAVEVSVLGSIDDNQQSHLVVQTKTDTDPELRLLLTRLNNPTTGMKIYEQGVDPEPILDQKVDEETETTIDENTEANAEVTDEDA